MNYSSFFPESARNIISVLQQSGFCAYFVGGCVRDFFMKRSANDFDITTDATSEEIIFCLEKNGIKASLTGGPCGTVSATTGGNEFEITPHRTEGGYYDHRHPTTVSFVKELERDLVRRDFTVNAMALTEREGKVLLSDPFGGKEDIEKKLLRTVGDAHVRFEEDALRILRAIRFSVQLGFDIEEKTACAVKEKAHLLSFVSGERKAQELRKTFENGIPERTVMAFDGIFAEIFGTTVCTPCGFCRGGFCEALFYLLKEKSVEEIESAVQGLKLTSTEKERIVSYKKMHDEINRNETVAFILLNFSEHLEKYARMFSDARLLDIALDESIPKSLKELKISGNDLAALGITGKAIGIALEKLFCAVVDRKILNDAAELFAFAKDIGKEI